MFGTLQPTANSFRDQLKANNNVVRVSSLPVSVPGGWPSDDASLTPGTPVPRASTDNQSAYWSTRSRFSFRSIFTGGTRDSLWSDSTGFRSQNGATWRQELVRNMNSGFGPGAPRDSTYRGVQEGRERGGFLPKLRGVGRLGKPPIRVPGGMVDAAKEASQKPSEVTLRRFEELRDWMVDMDKELMRSSLADEGPQPFVLSSIRKDLYAVQAEWQKAYKEMHGEQCSDLEGKIEEYRAGPELYHRAAVGAIREDILAYNRAYAKVKYSKEEMATFQQQLADMNVALKRIPGPLPGERKARIFLKYSSMAEHSEQLDVADRLEKLAEDLDIDEGSVSNATRNDAVLRVRNPGNEAQAAPIKAPRKVAEAINQKQKEMSKRLEQEVEDRESISTSTAVVAKRLENVKLDLEAFRGEIRKLVANGTHLKGGQGSLEGERRYQRARKIALIKELLKFDDEVRLTDGEEHGLQSYTTKERHTNSLRQLLQEYEESALVGNFPLYQ